MGHNWPFSSICKIRFYQILFYCWNWHVLNSFIFTIFYIFHKIKCWPQSDSNTQPSDLESYALPLRHRATEQIPCTRMIRDKMKSLFFLLDTFYKKPHCSWKNVVVILIIVKKKHVLCHTELLYFMLLFYNYFHQNKMLTPEWLEHPAFWSGVIRATIAP